MRLSNLFNENGNGAGRFTLPTGEEVEGRISLVPGRDYFLLEINQLRDHYAFPPEFHRSIIHGLVNQGNQPVTLIGSTPTLSNYTPPIPPYFINCRQLLVGQLHFSQDKHKIVETRFRLSGSSSIFPIYANGISPGQEILKAIMGESLSPSDPGERPDRVFYCSGPAELFSCDLGRYGRVSVRKSNVTKLPGRLPRVDVRFTIKHPPDTDSFNAENAIQCVTRFFWLITGTRQYAENIKITVITPEDDMPHNFDAYFPLQEVPISARADCVQTDYYRLLINPFESRHDLEKCLSRWSNLSGRQRIACDLMLGQFSAPLHPPYRISLAAVAFEWFEEAPPSAGENDASDPVKDIVDFAKSEIRNRWDKPSPERERVLTKLGEFVNHHRTLRNKVQSRLDLVLNHINDEMKNDIDKVVAAAVKSRNKYIHGHTKRPSKDQDLSEMFFALTLEFIFLSSVLVECGWDMKSWNERECQSINHPFDRYVMDWTQFYGIWQRFSKTL